MTTTNPTPTTTDETTIGVAAVDDFAVDDAAAKDVVEAPKPKRTRARKAEASETDGLKPKRTRARKTPAPVVEPAKTARSTYPAEITEAVRLAKAARGMSKHAPGAKQHVMVRAVVGDGATVAEIVKASGAKSEKHLRALADGSAPTADVGVLRPLGGQFDDPWCRGRNLASILVAMVDQAKAKS
jgi:hypothetical protein